MARIPLGALTTLNLSTHLDPMFTELYTAAGGNFSASPFLFIGDGTGSRELRINGGTTAAQGANLILQRGGAPHLAVGSVDSVLGTGGSDVVYYAYGTNAQRFYTNGSERLRIDSSGNVVVNGNVSPLAAANRGLLTISGSNQAFIGFASGATSLGYVAGTSAVLEIASSTGYISLTANNAERVRVDQAGNTVPGADNTQWIGSPSKRWAIIYAGTGTINTSDAREKTKVAKLTPSELKAAQEIAREIGVYKFLSSVEDKGDAARIHAGLTVQRAIEIMENNGLEPFAYAFICHDEWEAEGDRPAGDRYGFRMDELMAFVCAGQQAAHDELESRIKALEAAK